MNTDQRPLRLKALSNRWSPEVLSEASETSRTPWWQGLWPRFLVATFTRRMEPALLSTFATGIQWVPAFAFATGFQWVPGTTYSLQRAFAFTTGLLISHYPSPWLPDLPWTVFANRASHLHYPLEIIFCTDKSSVTTSSLRSLHWVLTETHIWYLYFTCGGAAVAQWVEQVD